MTQKRKSVFISYSWDSEAHQNWVHQLTNKLRGQYGIDATIDKIETQKKTVHLPKMMIENIRDRDYTIIVLSKQYALKADAFEGGVGFENKLMLHLLQYNPDKLIFIKRDQFDFDEVLPYHFKGYHTIDFSNDHNFNERLEELAYRIYQTPLYEEEPLGEIPDLKPRKLEINNRDPIFNNHDLIITNPIIDLQKDKFLKDSFMALSELFTKLFNQIKSIDSTFHFEYEEISTYKSIFTLYQNESEKTKMKMWLGNQFIKGIHFAYGSHMSVYQDNSFNETLSCEVSDNKLILKMTMNIFGSSSSDPKDIVSEIWTNHLKPSFT